MKFLAKEYRPIQESLEKMGFSMNDFQFVKKRGKLHIFFGSHENNAFVFYRKSETVLDENKQWQKLTVYIQYSPIPERVYTDWKQVLANFEGWLRSLKRLETVGS